MEAIGGEIRIGEELSAFQELLKDWFYTCYCLGTIIFAVMYFMLQLATGIIWWALRERWRLQAELDDEPPCVLDFDPNEDFDDIRFEDYEDMPPDNDGGEEGRENGVEQSDEQGAGVEDRGHNTARGVVSEDRGHVVHSSRVNDITLEDDENDEAWEDLQYPDDSSNRQNETRPVPSSFTTPLSSRTTSLPRSTPVVPERLVSERPTTTLPRRQPVVVQTVREMTDEELSVELLRRVQSEDDTSSGTDERHPFLFFLFG